MSQPITYSLAEWVISYNEMIRDVDRLARASGADPEGPRAEHFRRLLADYRGQYEAWVREMKEKRRSKPR